jgi:hypothetical protein
MSIDTVNPVAGKSWPVNYRVGMDSQWQRTLIAWATWILIVSTIGRLTLAAIPADSVIRDL